MIYIYITDTRDLEWDGSYWIRRTLRFIGAAAYGRNRRVFLVCHQDGDVFFHGLLGKKWVYNALTVKDRDMSWEYHMLKKWEYHLKTMDH